MKSLASKALAALPFVGAASWSGYVYWRRAQPIPREEFIQGSMDETIMNTLQTGDLVLFNRKCALMQPVGSSVCGWTKALSGSEYDHFGVVIIDKNGEAFILEETFSGIKYRPYSSRILRSMAQEILVIPLKYKRTLETRRLAHEFIDKCEKKTSRSAYSQLWRLIMATSAIGREQVEFNSPAAALLMEFYDYLGLVAHNDSSQALSSIPPEKWTSHNDALISNAQFGVPIPIRLQ